MSERYTTAPMEPARLANGSSVIVNGAKTERDRTDLNGKAATILGWDSGNGCYELQIEGVGGMRCARAHVCVRLCFHYVLYVFSALHTHICSPHVGCIIREIICEPHIG